MSLAADTRSAIRQRPFLRDALRSGVVNYAALARTLDIDGEESAVVAALRRYAEELPTVDETPRAVRVTMESGLSISEATPGDSAPPALLAVGGRRVVADGTSHTGISATGAVDSAALAHVLGCLQAEGVEPAAAGVAGDSLLVVVPRSNGPTALRTIERALDAVPDPP